MNVLALADSFDRAGLDIGEEIVQVARVECEKPPSSATLTEIARRVRRDQYPTTDYYVLPGGAGVPMPPEIHARYVAMVERRHAEREAESVEDIEQRRSVAERMRLSHGPQSGAFAFVVVEPTDPCDRCPHPSRRHRATIAGSDCLAKGCLCDGFFAQPAQAVSVGGAA